MPGKHEIQVANPIALGFWIALGSFLFSLLLAPVAIFLLIAVMGGGCAAILGAAQ
jgi:hypothetical protein